MKYVLRDKDDADITMITASRKQIAHKSAGIGVVQQIIRYEYTEPTPKVFIIHWHAFVITDVQI